MKKKSLTTLVVLVLCGCANPNQYPVNYVTSPSKAMISCGDRDFGYSPVVLYWDKSTAMDRPVGTDCKATWLSGTTKYFPSVTPQAVKQYPNGATNTLKKSPDEPGYDTDAQAAFYADQNRRTPVTNQEYQYKPPTNTYCNKVAGQVMCTTY